MNLTKGMTSTGNVIASTPREFFDSLSKIFNFSLDACALPENAKCELFYTPADDGLSKPWRGGMVQSALWKGDISMGQERLRGIEEGIQRLRTCASSSPYRYQVVARMGAGQGDALLRKGKNKVWETQYRSPLPFGAGFVYEDF